MSVDGPTERWNAPDLSGRVALVTGASRGVGRGFDEENNYFSGWTSDDFYHRTASIHYAGRAVAALATDEALLERTGTLVTSHDAAIAYNFTDTNGTQPGPD